jgi:hypothetical protein
MSGIYSIWLARELLKEGLMWRVRNDAHINIWKDNWLHASKYSMVWFYSKGRRVI